MNSQGALALVGSGEYLPVMQDLESALIQSGIKNGKANTFIQLPTAAGNESTERLKHWQELGEAQARRIGSRSRRWQSGYGLHFRRTRP